MSDNNNNNNNNGGSGRRNSFAAETFGNIFGRSKNGTQAGTPATPAPPQGSARPRRMSVTTSLGINTGTSPIQNSYFRRGSESTGESAIDDDDEPSYAQSVPTTPFTRRMSIGAGAMLASRGGTSPSTGPGMAPPSTLPKIPAKQRVDHDVSSSAPASSFLTRHSSLSHPSKRSGLRSSSISSQVPLNSVPQASTFVLPRDMSDISHARAGEGLNVYEQFRSRAQSSVNRRPSFSGMGASPNATARPMQIQQNGSYHERAKSISDMPEPPKVMPERSPQPPRPERRKPDEVGERMLRGEFLMD